jgi:hypothetical protein
MRYRDNRDDRRQRADDGGVRRRDPRQYGPEPRDAREYGRDEPWREEGRNRYPAEPRRVSTESGDFPDRINRGDYRDDFGPPKHRDEGDERSRRGGERENISERGWGERNREGWRRSLYQGGFGSEFGAWRTGSGPDPEWDESPGGGHASHRRSGAHGEGEADAGRRSRGDQDTDWSVTRPARGRGTWAGDWGRGRPEEAGTPPPREDYAGRSPRDYRRSDGRLHEEICERFTHDPRLDPTDIEIQVADGEVTLTGYVSSREQKRHAEELAERVTGVGDVINLLRVNRNDPSAPADAAREDDRRRR